MGDLVQIPRKVPEFRKMLSERGLRFSTNPIPGWDALDTQDKIAEKVISIAVDDLRAIKTAIEDGHLKLIAS